MEALSIKRFPNIVKHLLHVCVKENIIVALLLAGQPFILCPDETMAAGGARLPNTAPGCIAAAIREKI